METLSLVVIFVVIFIVVKTITSSKKKNKSRRIPSALTREYKRNETMAQGNNAWGQTTSISPSRQGTRATIQPKGRGDYYYKSGQYQRAFEEYNRENKIFKAALSLARQGPDHTTEVISYLRSKNPDVLNITVSNLVEQLYNKFGEVSTSAALYRAIGRSDEAMAIEIANNIPSTEKFIARIPSEEDYKQATYIQSEPQIREVKPPVSSPPPEAETQIVEEAHIISGIGHTTVSSPKIASSTLDIPCVVCKKEISAGDTYVNCPHCGTPGHKRHVLEWAKAIGKCKNCKNRLSMSDFSSE